MEETPQGAGAPAPAGEATPSASPAVNPEAGQTTDPGENPSNPGGKEPENSKFVPYERFEEVNKKMRDYETKLSQFAPKLEVMDKLQSAFSPQEAEDYSQFESPQQFMGYLEEKNKKFLAEREEALKHDILSSVNARYELETLKSEYPELKEDKEFRDIVVNQMALNPARSPREIVSGVKKYLESVTEKAKKAHEEEFLSKGTYSGKSGNNQPYQSDEDKEVANSIVNAGKRGGIF